MSRTIKLSNEKREDHYTLAHMNSIVIFEDLSLSYEIKG